MITYTTAGTQMEIRAQSSTATVGFQNAIVIVGGYNATEADSSVTAGEVYEVSNGNDAQDLFGSSELARVVESASPNGAETLKCIPVPETTGTVESFAATASGTLSNVPFDPNLHPEHDITAQDTVDATSVEVNIVYDDSPDAPSTANTINLNPRNKKWTADASSDYDITYDHGSYGNAINTAAAENVRDVALCAEDAARKSTLQTELEAEAQNFEFRRGITGAHPEVAAADIGTYTPDTDDWRVVEVAPARGYIDGKEVRTVGAIASMLAHQPINVSGSITYDEVQGLTDLRTEYRGTEAQDFERVTGITRSFNVTEGVTTSSTEEFQDIYQVESVDLVAESIYAVEEGFLGGANLVDDRKQLSSDLRRLLRGFSRSRPPVLATGDGDKPWTLGVSQGSVDTAVDVSIGVEPAPIMKQINLDLNVGSVTTFQGATVQ